MESPNWHYADGRQSIGPIPFEQLRGLAFGGAIQPGTLVWREGMPEWVTADTLPELWSGAPVMSAAGTPGAIGYESSFAAPPYAGFWRRVLAYIIDAIIIGIPNRILMGSLGSGLVLTPGGALHPHLAIMPFFRPANIIGILIGWLYFALMESSTRQATLGKMALGMYVTDLSGARISFGRATGRHFAKFLSSIILGIGFLMVAFTEKKQGLHDMLASTIVLNRQ